MSYGYPPQGGGYGSSPPAGSAAQNLQFYSSTYSPGPVSGHATPASAAYGYGGGAASMAYGAGPSSYGSGGFGAVPVSGRMGESGGLRTGWLAAFGTEGYEGEPPLLEELGVNFGHIRGKVRASNSENHDGFRDVSDANNVILYRPSPSSTLWHE
jgi:hypothetical protein